jgi:uncharacterized membrane protein YdjX (TVP38/TMEM64 family)
VTVLAGAAAAFVLLPVKETLARFAEWVRDLGWWGPVVFVIVYALACLIIPGSVLSLGAGFAFGVVLGTVAVSLGSVTTASLAFGLARTLFRGWVEARVAVSPRFRAIDQAVAENGFKIVLLTRLSPVFPFLLLNYAFGLTRVRFRDYFFASWVGMLPGTVLYVYLGSAIHDFADLVSRGGERTPAQMALFWAGLAATAVVTILVTHIARRALKQALPAVEPPTGAEPAGARPA